ncbi:MAG: hypothetical protein HY236_06845 [Acidobacteria bacterium]|nr:hypothetical protein [Acidobacteriota bacterium]
MRRLNLLLLLLACGVANPASMAPIVSPSSANPASFAPAGGAFQTGGAPTFRYTIVQTGATILPGGTFTMPATKVGSSSAIQFQAQNTGSAPATVNRIAFSAMVFELIDVPELPVSLDPGSSLTFTIQFMPDTPGFAKGALDIDGSDFTVQAFGMVGGVTISGPGATVPPAQQPMVGVTLDAAYKILISGKLILSFSSVLGDDPAVQFAGGRAVDFTVPINSKQAMFGTANQIAFQSGTVAGTISFTVTLQASGTDMTPLPAPSFSTQVSPAAPVINSIAIKRTGTGFELSLVAFATSKAINKADFQLTPSGTGNLQTSSISLDVGTLFADWYKGASSTPFGSLFALTVPFTVNGNISAIRSVSATLTNAQGTSNSMSALP